MPLFNSSLGLKLDTAAVVRELLIFMKNAPRYSYKIIIGSDSLLFSDKTADFVTTVVIHREGNGGRYFWRRLEIGKFHTLRDRIIQEVLYSIEAAKLVLSELQKETAAEPSLRWSFEVHADIGEKGETRTLIQEVVGMIRANNFEARTKPLSYAATKVADRHT